MVCVEVCIVPAEYTSLRVSNRSSSSGLVLAANSV